MGKKKYYHGTRKENLTSIMDKGLLSKFEGVYLTNSVDSASRWMIPRLLASDVGKLIVIEVTIDSDSVVEGCDHSEMMVKLFGVGESWLSIDNIPSDKITNVFDVELGLKDEITNGSVV